MNRSVSRRGKAGAGPGQELMSSLLHTAHLVEKRYEEALATVELSGPKFAALTYLVEAGVPLSLSECAEKMTCVRSNITQLMDRLEADGLVRRVEDPSDRRTIRAALTPVGAQRQARGAQEVEKVQKEFARLLSGIDQTALRQALEALR
jgi:DNA-binding MarR family transcriptional regulator